MSDPDPKILCLFDRVLSHSADEQEYDRLESQLEADPRVRDWFARYAQLDVDLRYAFRTGAVSIAEVAGAGVTGSPKPASARREASGRRSAIDYLRHTRLAWSLSIAATIAIATMYFGAESERCLPQIVSKPPGPVATLGTQSGAVWDGVALQEGAAIREGETLQLVSGNARISVGFGAEIAAEGPCSLSFVSQDRVRLNHGDITVQVAEWAKGFTIVTEGMDVIDLGTTFSVSASKGVAAQTRVIKGQVRVSPKTAPIEGPRSVLVSAGEACLIDNEGRRSEGLPDTNPAAAVDFSGLRPYKPLALYNSGLGFGVGDEDPNWRVVAGPGVDPAKARFAVVCEPDERYMPNEPGVSQWVSFGDWRTAKSHSVYTFQTSFDLRGFDLTTIQLFGRFLADNGIREVRVNGSVVDVESWADNVFGQSFGDHEFRTVNVTDGLVAGENVIEIDVWNGVFQHMPPDTPNPMALRVEWFAFGRHGLQASNSNPWDGDGVGGAEIGG